MRKRRIFQWSSIFLAMMIGVVVLTPVRVSAEPTVNLGTTESFAVLAGTTVTNTGTTVIGGSAGANVGVYSGTAVTGFPPAMIIDGGVVCVMSIEYPGKGVRTKSWT